MRKYAFDSGIMAGGLNNCDDETIIENKQFSDCQNIIFDKDNYPQKRPPVITGMNNATNEATWHTNVVNEGSGKTKRTSRFYTYQKRDGTEYYIAFVDGNVLKATTLDVGAWTTILTGLNVNYLPSFTTFKDRLIISNGYDEMYYWDGVMGSAVKTGGAVPINAGTGSTVNNGVHKFKLTYETGGNKYAYDIVTEINVISNWDVNLTHLPLGPDASDVTRKIWATKAGENTFYLFTTLNPDNVSDSVTFNVADTDLTVAYDGTGVISVQPPKSRFLEVFDGKLFAGHSLDAPSEVNWTEADNFEDFLPFNVTAVNVDDGEFITGLKTYKAHNQLITFKKNGLYVMFASGDTYLYRSMSFQGCTLDGSIQEFHCEDEYISRDVIIYANGVGVWEYDGQTVRQISRQPKGSTITHTWQNVKQRRVNYRKNIKTTKTDFDAGILDIRLNVDGSSNWMESQIGQMSLKNPFIWNDSVGIGADTYLADAFCNYEKNGVRRIYKTYVPGAPTGALGYHEWDAANKRWGDVQVVDTSGYYQNTVKMEYNNGTDRIIGITTDGKIWRTTAGVTGFEDSTNFTITSLTGATTCPQFKCNHYIYMGNDYYEYSTGTVVKNGEASIPYSGYPISQVRDINDGNALKFKSVFNYFYVPDYMDVTNNWTNTVYYRKNNPVEVSGGIYNGTGTPIPTPSVYDGTLTAGETKKLMPGYYSMWAIGKDSDGYMDVSYARRGNLDLKTITADAYFVDQQEYCTPAFPGSENIYSTNTSKASTITAQGQSIYHGYPVKILKKFYIPTKAISTVANVGRDLVFLGDYIYTSSVNAIFVSYSDETNDYANFIKTINPATNLISNAITSSTYGFLRHREYFTGATASTLQIISELKEISTGDYYRAERNNGVWNYKVEKVTMYNNANKSIPLMLSDKRKIYFFQDNFNLYETQLGSSNSTSLNTQGTPTSVRAALLLDFTGSGIPSMVMTQFNTGRSYWRGVIGNYTLQGNWITSFGKTVDTGEDGADLMTYESDVGNAGNGTVDRWLYIGDSDTGTPLIPSSVEWGNPVSLGVKLQDNGYPIDGNQKRFIHQMVSIEYSLNNVLTSVTDAWLPPAVESLILNWLDIEGGTTIPKTNVTSAVVGNFYYLAFCELRGKERNEADANVNNCVLVLDRFKRWSIWRGDGLYPASFAVYKDKLYWSDARCINNDPDWQSDYFYYMGERNQSENQFTDMYANAVTGMVDLQGIDAFYVTKNFTELAQFDSIMQKKEMRMMYIMGLRYATQLDKTTYSLLVGHNVDEVKDVDGIDAWTEQTINLMASDGGKTTKRITFGNGETLGYRHRRRFRNNVIGEDLAMVRYQETGFIYHSRWTE